jgi:Iap family predicted aminopeptidase
MICPSLCNLFDYTIASVTRGSGSVIHSPAEKNINMSLGDFLCHVKSIPTPI